MFSSVFRDKTQSIQMFSTLAQWKKWACGKSQPGFKFPLYCVPAVSAWGSYLSASVSFYVKQEQFPLSLCYLVQPALRKQAHGRNTVLPTLCCRRHCYGHRYQGDSLQMGCQLLWVLQHPSFTSLTGQFLKMQPKVTSHFPPLITTIRQALF